MALVGLLVVALAVAFIVSYVYGQNLAKEGTPKAEAEKKLTEAGSAGAVLVVALALFLWPSGKPWHKMQPIEPVYKLIATYLKPPAGKPPAGYTKESYEETYVPIRKVLLGSIICIGVALVSGAMIAGSKDTLLGGASSKKHNYSKKGYASPWG